MDSQKVFPKKLATHYYLLVHRSYFNLNSFKGKYNLKLWWIFGLAFACCYSLWRVHTNDRKINCSRITHQYFSFEHFSKSIDSLSKKCSSLLECPLNVLESSFSFWVIFRKVCDTLTRFSIDKEQVTKDRWILSS